MNLIYPPHPTHFTVTILSRENSELRLIKLDFYLLTLGQLARLGQPLHELAREIEGNSARYDA